MLTLTLQLGSCQESARGIYVLPSRSSYRCKQSVTCQIIAELHHSLVRHAVKSNFRNLMKTYQVYSALKTSQKFQQRISMFL